MHQKYLDYQNLKSQAEAALAERQAEYDAAKKPEIQEKRNQLAKDVLIENFGKVQDKLPGFTDKELYIIKSLYSQATYTNENIIVTTLDSTVDAVDKSITLYKDALEELYVESHPQYTYTDTVDNIYALPEFKEYHKQLSVNDFVRLGLSDTRYVKLRVINITYNPCDLDESMELTFSNVITYKSKKDDFTNLLNDTANTADRNGGKFTDTNTWRPLGTTGDTACAGNDSRLSNARPASDVYSWAKASSKPSYSWGEITGKPSTFAPAAHSHNKVSGAYTGNGGQQKPNYFGTNQVGFLMMNTAVNNNTHYKDWIIMDCYSGSDVGGAVAFGVNRQSLGAYIMRSESGRASWAESAELLHTSNYTSYTVTKTGSGASGTWGINVSGGAAYPTGFSSRVTSATWGNQTGTLITDWHTSNGGDIQFRDNNGQLNVIIDGIFYQNEGRNVVLDSANYASYAAPKDHTHNYAGSSSAGGNANAAVKLATARTINGTSFNGSANITTANWGTARTITVGNTGKSVNGSGNVSWSLGEIGVHVSNKEPAASDGKNGDVWIVYEG